MLLQVPLIRKIKLLVAILIGSVLIFSILFSINNLLVTYDKTKRVERRTIWSLVQVSKEARKTLYAGNSYLLDRNTLRAFQRQYEVLWSRIPVALIHLENEEIKNGDQTYVNQEQDLARAQSLNHMFELLKSVESVILSPAPTPTLSKVGWRS